ncbi:MAG: glycosyltransferase family 4 protein [Acidobacteriota bacterium]
METSSEPVSSKASAEGGVPCRAPRRVAVVTSDVPFVEGGHRRIAEGLAAALRRAGHQAEVIPTPQNRFGRQLSAYLATWLTDVGESGDGVPVDQVISLRYPSYAVRHRRHICWLNHRMREYYDLWPRFARQLSWKGRIKETIRRSVIRAVDRYLLPRNVTHLYAQSKTVQDRLERWGGIPSEVVYPPPPDRPYRTEAYENYVFAVSRLHSLKRLDLLVKAMKHVKSQELRAVIAGTGEEEDTLRRLAGELGVASRVSFLGWIDDDELVHHYARCRAVFFAPFMEDFGFVTVEAFRSGKPVMTCLDSGGPAELVAHGRSGYVLLPGPHFLARQLDVWAAERELAVRMGELGKQSARGITWEAALDKLLR